MVLSTLQALKMPVEGVLDERSELWGLELMGVPVVGDPQDYLLRPGARAVLAIGSNRARQTLNQRFLSVEWVLAVHPQAYLDSNAHIGAGSVVFAGAVIQPLAQIGQHCIINTGATVDHDCLLGDYVHLAPGCHLAGNVRADEGSFLGIGSSVIPGVHIGAWATLGAGSVALHSVGPHRTAVGVPARELPR